MFKGFGVESGVEFEGIVRQYSPELSDEYRGTSPRKLIPGTKVNLAYLVLKSSLFCLLEYSMYSQPVSSLHPTPSLNIWRCPSSLPLQNNSSSAVLKHPRQVVERPVFVTTRRSMISSIQQSGRSLKRKG